MKFLECMTCHHRHDEDVCDECDSGEMFEESDELNFEPGYDNDR